MGAAVDVRRERVELLDAMVEALAQGRCAEGEALLVEALDDGLPWDRVTSAAARATIARFEPTVGPAARS